MVIKTNFKTLATLATFFQFKEADFLKYIFLRYITEISFLLLGLNAFKYLFTKVQACLAIKILINCISVNLPIISLKKTKKSS